MPPAKSQLNKDRYIRASNFQARSQMLSVLSAEIKWKSRSTTRHNALISDGKEWSAQMDLNHQAPGPEPDAMPYRNLWILVDFK